MMKSIYGLFLLTIFSIKYSSIGGKTFFVSGYGAYPHDNIDGAVNDIVFGYGIYTISSTIIISNATNLTIIG